MLASKIYSDSPVKLLDQYKIDLQQELNEILNFWMEHVVDEKNGGFYGALSNKNIPDPSASKGVVLNSRILWTFSAVGSNNAAWRKIADRAFEYIQQYFIDREYGGVYWSVDSNGKMLDGKKQIYGLAFCIYGLSEYYKLTTNPASLGFAKQLFNQIEQYSFDKVNGGYIEALTQNWQPIDDLRLSEKDNNEKKTMNTHLHILEAYANLYSVWPEIFLREKIINLLEIFDKQFLDKANYHYRLFMSEEWESKSTLQSFGHDIEASWLLYQCAEIIGNDFYIDRFRDNGLLTADEIINAIDKDGGLWYEYNPAYDLLIKEKHWWPQAETMIGFFNAWQLSDDDKYLQLSMDSWGFVKKYIKDHENEEWFWGVNEDYSIMQKDKVGFWKCPYHNTRACLEISKRISSIQ